MQSFHRHRGADAIATMTDDGVLLVRFQGVLTRSVLDAIKGNVATAHAAVARAVVADYRASILAMSAAELEHMMTSRSAANLPALPAAVVVSEPMADVMDRLAANALITHGMFRVVALDPTAALRWVRARLHARSRVRRAHPVPSGGARASQGQ